MVTGYQIIGTRPTQDRIKESLFAMIQDEIREKIVLDLFAGTGNLAFEALSNGASYAYVVDKNRECTKAIEKTKEAFHEKNIEIRTNDYQKALDEFHQEKKKFSIIFLDPPYKEKKIENILQELEKKELVSEDGLVICEYEKDDLKEDYPNYHREKYRKYGSKQIAIYRFQKEEK